jgi:serine/threonine-protein kinase
LRIAVTPWGEVELDGKKMGVSPPLTSLTLEPGEHVVVLRNTDFAPRTFRIKVEAGKNERVSHKFE